jgi:hypothetical protein
MRPHSTIGWWTVDSDGASNAAGGMSSKPITSRSSEGITLGWMGLSTNHTIESRRRHAQARFQPPASFATQDADAHWHAASPSPTRAASRAAPRERHHRA